MPNFFQRMILANYGHPGIEVLEMSRVDRITMDELVRECLTIATVEASSVVGRTDHGTYWTKPWGEVRQWSLVNLDGAFDGQWASSHYIGGEKGFHHGDKYPRLAEFISTRPRLVNCRLNGISPGSGLSPHKEQVVIRGVDGSPTLKARFHLPVTSSDQCRVMVAWKSYRLFTGRIYYVNNGCPHGAWNDGAQLRLHIVWDTILQPGDIELFKGCKYVGHLEDVNRIDHPVEGETVPAREAMEAWA